MPTNHKFLATQEVDIGTSTVDLIRYWGKLHSVRTLLGLLATGVFVWTLV